MHRTLPRTVSALVLALAAGMGSSNPCLAAAQTPLTPQQSAALKAQQPARALQAGAHLNALRTHLGLDGRAGFAPRHISTNPEGRTIVHFQQTHDGHRVWGGEAIAHVEADGTVKALTQGVKPGISLANETPRITGERAQGIALRNLAAQGPLHSAPKVELVVFPTKFAKGLATRLDPKLKTPVLDTEMSLFGKAPSDAYVLAYEVKTVTLNAKDGHKEMNYIVDATTGAILRKWSALQGDTPATGTGKSFFRGDVPLSTTLATDGSFALQSMNHGTQPNPFVLAQGVSQIGLTTYFGYADTNGTPADSFNWLVGFLPYDQHATNVWGDGTLIPSWDYSGMPPFDFSADSTMAWFQGARTVSGETTAVDAHFGLSTTWDFYKNVFNRDGIDDAGTSTFAIVHEIQYSGWFSPIPYVGNANWSPYFFGMEFGEGDYPANPNGFIKTFTELDITGHELTHGVTQYSAGLIYSDLSGGLNEATSDMMGKMVQAYADGGGTGATVPNFPAGDLTKWAVAYNSTNPTSGLRTMFKPSLDGYSADGWYDGLEQMDVHFSSGPPNRFFYFLCMGASSNASSYTYSPYLPGGMTGLGNDKAAQIWYKTLTEHLPSDADFEVARAASITAAEEIFGADSTESRAVMNAWAAANVGAAYGQPAPVRVTFPVIHPADTILYDQTYPVGVLAKIQIFPTDSTVSLHCDVQNTTNTKVTWDQPYWQGGFGPNAPAGTINADGSWTIPAFDWYMSPIYIQGTSQADPNQFARSWVLIVKADANTDTELDAFDLGAISMAWGLPQVPNPAVRVAGVSAGAAVTDWDVEFFNEALANAMPVH